MAQSPQTDPESLLSLSRRPRRRGPVFLLFCIYRPASAQFLIDLTVIAIADAADLSVFQSRLDGAVRFVDMDTAVESAFALPLFEFRIIVVEAVRFYILHPQRCKSRSIHQISMIWILNMI